MRQLERSLQSGLKCIIQMFQKKKKKRNNYEYLKTELQM